MRLQGGVFSGYLRPSTMSTLHSQVFNVDANDSLNSGIKKASLFHVILNWRMQHWYQSFCDEIQFGDLQWEHPVAAKTEVWQNHSALHHGNRELTWHLPRRHRSKLSRLLPQDDDTKSLKDPSSATPVATWKITNEKTTGKIEECDKASRTTKRVRILKYRTMVPHHDGRKRWKELAEEKRAEEASWRPAASGLSK